MVVITLKVLPPLFKICVETLSIASKSASTTFETQFNQLLQKERQKKQFGIGISGTSTSVFAAKYKGKGNQKQKGRSSNGQSTSTSTSKAIDKSEIKNLKCYYSGEVRHLKVESSGRIGMQRITKEN